MLTFPFTSNETSLDPTLQQELPCNPAELLQILRHSSSGRMQTNDTFLQYSLR